LDEHDPAVAVASECSKLERELNAANDHIKRLESKLVQIDKWYKAKEANP
jgi:predicted  nucleic acid-binding Zn-ribbon protein